MDFNSILHLSGGNLNEPTLRKKINLFLSKYYDKYKESAIKTNIPFSNFSIGKPCNYYFVIDRIKSHFIYSSDFAGAMKEIIYVDFRSQNGENFSIDEITTFLRSQKGFVNWHGFSIDSNLLLNKTEEDITKFAEENAEQNIQQEFQDLIKQHQPLFISIEQLEKFIRIATEDEFTQILVVPLLRHLGFNTAEAKGHKDKSLEFGQDIQRMKLQIPTGHFLYFSGQVKRGDIKANSNKLLENVNHILNQTSSQLEWEMPDTESNSLVKPDHILLIVSGDITEGAKQFIFRHDLFKRKRVLLWEKETILRLCREKGLPEQVQKIILEYNKNNN